MSAKRSADIPVREPKPKRGLENPRSLEGLSSVAQRAKGEDSEETWGMNGKYPADWSTPELGEFAKATGGSRFPPAAQGSKEGDYPFYKVSDMNLPGNERFMGVANHWITEGTRKKIKAKTFPSGSVIFPKIGAAVATNKKRLLTQESIIDNNVMAVVVEDPQVCAFGYLRFWFETIDLRDLSNSGALPSIPGHRVHSMNVPLPPLPEQKKIAHILSTVQRAIATRAVSQSNISATRLKGFPVPKPSLDEQNEIVAHAKVLDGKLAAHRSKLEQLQDLFRTLLHELMTAKTRVHRFEFQIQDA